MYGGRQGFKRKWGSYKGGAKPFSKKRRSGGRSSNKGGLLRPGGNGNLLSHPYRKSPGGGSSGNRSTVFIQRQSNWLPDRLEVPLKWTFVLAYSITAGVGQEAAFIANSIADPGGSSAATNPYGYDQLSLLYAQYRVRASAIRATLQIDPASGSTSATNNSVFFAVFPSRRTTTYTSDPMGAAQQPYGKYTQAQGNNVSYQPATIYNYLSTAKMLGLRQQQVLGDPNLAALINADPGTKWYWHVLVTQIGSSLSTTIEVSIEMIQYCELYDLNDLAST